MAVAPDQGGGAGVAGAVGGSVQLALVRGAVLRRGARDDGARGLDGAKVAVAAARQAVAASGMRPARVVLLADRAPEAESASAWLADLVDARESRVAPVLGFATFTSVLNALVDAAAAPGVTALVIVGECLPPATHDHESYARALLAHDPTMERRVAAELLGVSDGGKIPAPAPSAGDRLVVEERPGKAVVLEIDQTTHKRLAKRWQAMTSGKERRTETAAPLLAPAGWGVAALLVAAPAAGAAKVSAVEMASKTWPVLGEFHDRGAAAEAVAKAAAWVASDTTGGAPKQIFILSPSYAHAAALTSAAQDVWGNSVKVAYPDLASGWHPGLSLLDALLHGQRPTLILGLGTWPSLHAVWLR